MSYNLMFQKAVELQQNGALNEAEQLYRQILETAPDNADVLNLLGLIAQTRGLHSEAIGYFYRAAASAPKHFPIFFNLGISLAAVGRPIEAIEAYKKALQLKPDLKEAFLCLGNTYWQINRDEEAAEAFENALKLDADYTDAAVNLAEIKNDEAALQLLAQKNPQDARPFYYLGRRKFAQQKYSEALPDLQKADGLLVSAEIKTLLAETFLALQQHDKALPLFYQALQLNPHDAAAALHIADLEAENQNFGEAEKYYKKAAELNPESVQAHANYANMLCKRKRILEALEEYRAAVRLAPEQPELSYNLAIILKTLEEYEQALALMFNAFYLAPQHADWSLNIAETITLFYAKSHEKALKIAENWYEKMPENTVAKHLWAVLNGKSSDNETEYNRLLFDCFAENYENVLQNISYNVVEKMAEIIPPLKGKVLDLGCGTGLIGEKFKNTDNVFYGIDLSAAMLKLAESKKVYQNLEHTDALAYLERHKNEFSAIISADVFCYFGELRPLLDAASPVRIIFSVETDSLTETYKIQPNGRYKHNPQYVEKLLKEAGYKAVKSYPLILRQENGQDVSGMIFDASF